MHCRALSYMYRHNIVHQFTPQAMLRLACYFDRRSASVSLFIVSYASWSVASCNGASKQGHKPSAHTGSHNLKLLQPVLDDRPATSPNGIFLPRGNRPCSLSEELLRKTSKHRAAGERLIKSHRDFSSPASPHATSVQVLKSLLGSHLYLRKRFCPQ
jgi:hypothetical protein